jgi:hypothetical protein
MGIVHCLRAEVAELVDALGSGSSGCKPVLVQVQSSAPFDILQHSSKCCFLQDVMKCALKDTFKDHTPEELAEKEIGVCHYILI